MHRLRGQTNTICLVISLLVPNKVLLTTNHYLAFQDTFVNNDYTAFQKEEEEEREEWGIEVEVEVEDEDEDEDEEMEEKERP